MTTFLSRFTPSLMSHEALERIFVQREALAARLVEDIRASATTGAKHQSLVVGPRGMGKTHLVALVYHRVKSSPGLLEHLAIAWLNEDEWSLTSYLDLLLRMLEALDTEEPEQQLSARIDELSGLADEQAIPAAECLLREAVGDRTLLLLIENLDEIFKGLGKEGQQRLRAFLQEKACCTVLATTQSLFGGVRLQTSPFYGFFRIYPLDELSFTEAVDLLANVAALQGDLELEEFVRSPVGRARVRALRHLAGGNPRVYVIFSRFVTVKSLNDLVSPFMQMLDELTPYYQSRLTYLSQQQRKIVDILCSEGGAVTVKLIAEKGRMTHQTASSQLKELREKGYVHADAEGRESYYELREPLMRLAIEVKKNRGGLLQIVVEFLRRWYTVEELEQQKARVAPQDVLSPPYLDESLRQARSLGDPRLAASLRDRDDLLRKRDYRGARLAAEEVLEYRGLAKDWFDYAWTLRQGHSLTPEELELLDRRLASLPDTSTGCTSRGWVHYVLDRDGEAVVAFDRALALDLNNADTHQGRGWALYALRRYADALPAFDRALALDPEDADTHRGRGLTLSLLDRNAEALLAFDHAVALNPESAASHRGRGWALQSLDRHAEALLAFDRTLILKFEDTGTHWSRGWALQNLDRHAEALLAFDRALALEPEDTDSHRGRGWALQRLQRYAEVLPAFDQALALDPENAANHRARGWALYDLDRHAGAAASGTIATWLSGDEPAQAAGISPSPANSEAMLGRVEALALTPIPNVWTALIPRLLHDTPEETALPALADALVRTIPATVPPSLPEPEAGHWLETWRSAAGDEPQFRLPLRLMGAALNYRKSGDRRFLLALPVEEREVLISLLEPIAQAHGGDERG